MPRIRPAVHSCFQIIFSRRWSPKTNVRTFEPRIPECLSAALANTPIFETLETKEAKPLHGGGSRSRRDGRRPFPFRDFCWRRLVRSGMREFDPSVSSQAVSQPKIDCIFVMKGLQNKAFRAFIVRSPDSENRQSKRESAKSLRPSSQIFPFLGDFLQRRVRSALGGRGGSQFKVSAAGSQAAAA